MIIYRIPKMTSASERTPAIILYAFLGRKPLDLDIVKATKTYHEKSARKWPIAKMAAPEYPKRLYAS